MKRLLLLPPHVTFVFSAGPDSDPMQYAASMPTYAAGFPPAPVGGLHDPFPPAPAAVPPTPPVPVPSAGKVDAAQEYAAKVHDAVQSAYFYPPVAASMRFSGRVRVEFILKDAHVIESHVMQTCGIGLFDRAAIEAVLNARYPAPPEHLIGQDLHYQLWVELATH